jgi:hypothetical protein
MKRATVDNVCATYADKGVKVTMKLLPDYPDTLLIEGNEAAFEFLGKLFVAHAKAINGCGFTIEPRGPGSAFFSKKSTMGVYLHRLPCDDPKRRRT